MRNGHRLDHVKEALGLLVRKLDAGDSIALVAFNSEARLVSPMNSAASRGALEDALFGLEANQGTNVASGLMLGFRTAAENLVAGAVNRVILLSDGVGNIGETDQARILESVEEFRKQDIYLNTIGVGLENHSDHFLEQLADRGDGVYNYIGSLGEAKKVMVDDFTKTLQPIARDVKIQVDFDPSQVESYRQLGYENRALRDDQFRDDKVDAGEVNAGHQVTALFEIVRKPQSTTGSFVTVRVRYKLPFAIDRGQIYAGAKRQAEAALEIEQTLRWDQVATSFHATSWGYRRDVLVAQFAELLRQSVHARGERAAELLSEVQMLTRERRGDPELGEFEGLLRRALPGLEKLEERYYARPEWQDVVDELRRMHYRIARGELLDLDEARSEKLLKQLEARLREMISATGAEDMRRLEGQIAEFLSAGGDVSPQRLQALDTREQLKALGYSR
jgi:hypothetical protein